MSHRIFTPWHSSSSSASPLGSSVRSSRYENPEQPPPFTPTRRRVASSGRFCCLMISLISLAADSLSRMGITSSPVGFPKALSHCCHSSNVIVWVRLFNSPIDHSSDHFTGHVDPPAGQYQIRQHHILQKPHQLAMHSQQWRLGWKAGSVHFREQSATFGDVHLLERLDEVVQRQAVQINLQLIAALHAAHTSHDPLMLQALKDLH